MLRAFIVGFEKVSKNGLLLLAVFLGLIDTLLHSSNCLKVPAKIVYDVAQNYFLIITSLI